MRGPSTGCRSTEEAKEVKDARRSDHAAPEDEAPPPLGGAREKPLGGECRSDAGKESSLSS